MHYCRPTSKIRTFPYYAWITNWYYFMKYEQSFVGHIQILDAFGSKST